MFSIFKGILFHRCGRSGTYLLNGTHLAHGQRRHYYSGNLTDTIGRPSVLWACDRITFALPHGYSYKKRHNINFEKAFMQPGGWRIGHYTYLIYFLIDSQGCYASKSSRCVNGDSQCIALAKMSILAMYILRHSFFGALSKICLTVEQAVYGNRLDINWVNRYVRKPHW